MATEDLGFLQEIDDALKVDNMEKILRRYGVHIIAMCVGIVVVTAASVFWRNHQREVNMERTSVMLEAQDMILSQKYSEAAKLLENAMQKDKNYPAIVKLQYASALMKEGQFDKAQVVYNEITSGSDAEPALHNLAAIDANIIVSSNKTLNRPKMDTGSGQPFATLAMELNALRLEKEGKIKEAHDMIQNLAADMSLSPVTHEMVVEILGGMGGEQK